MAMGYKKDIYGSFRYEFELLHKKNEIHASTDEIS